MTRTVYSPQAKRYKRITKDICYFITPDGTHYSCGWNGQIHGAKMIAPSLTKQDVDNLDKHDLGNCKDYLHQVLGRRCGVPKEKLKRAPWEVIARYDNMQVVRIYV